MDSHDKKFALYFKGREKSVLARGETENTIVETKKSKKLEGILIADGEEWNEPDTTYNAEYPKNHVF